MEIHGQRIATLKFPEPAGELQRARATASLLRELGDNYDKYHAFLAAELDRFDERPRAEGLGSLTEYMAQWERIDEIIAAEVLLRVCRAHRKEGRKLGAPVDLSQPLIDTRDRLVSIETGKPLADATGTAASPRKMPPMPSLGKWGADATRD